MGVIITGIGMLNALGVGRGPYWQELLTGNCGIRPIESFDTSPYRTNVGGEIRSFDPKVFMPPRFYRRLSRLSRLAVAASIEALEDSELELGKNDRDRVGAVFGTAFGSTQQTDAFFMSLLDHGPEAAEPILFPDTVPNAPASHVAIYHQLQGPTSTLCQNHLSGECALAFAISLLETNQADALVVGGADELTSILFRSLDAIGALKVWHGRERFDPGQLLPGRGFIPGEGATCLVVEREGDAKKRKTLAHGELLSLTLASAATSQGHYDQDGVSLARTISAALDEAQLKPDEIDLIGLAANGVKELEDAEARALERVFGPRWHQTPRMPLRYFVGEFGSAGLLTAATIMLALREGVLPPSIQGRELTGVPGDPLRFAPAREARLRAAMSIGSTFGGGSSCLIVAKADLR